MGERLDLRPRTGRMRLDVDGEWRSPESVCMAEDTLRAIPGVSDVTVDASTGSVLIVYTPPARPAASEVCEAPPDGAHAASDRPTTARPSRATVWAVWIGETVALVALEMALQRALGPLFLRRRC